MSLSAFSFASLKTQKRAKSMYLNSTPEIEIDTSLIKQIGNYKLGEEIGSGAFGKVILGIHITTGEKVAIKILDKIILSQTPEDYELVRQELNILKIVKHKYIVQLYEILETPQHIFIIMEYCEGQDIMDYILTRSRLSEDESLKYFQQLINALYYLHSQNITHRDIKIDNLLLDKNLDLKLIDFGLSTKYRDDRLLNQPCGTVVYAAPEVLDCREYHGMLADVWSSGIVLFGMLSGFLPFGDPDDEVNKRLVLKGKIEIPKFFSREVTDLLKHMLDINPLTRYTLEEIMTHPWFNKNKFKLIPGIIIGINKIPIDEKIVNLCVTYNVDKNKVKNSVLNNKFNTESALYYLLVKKLKACGNDSISDLCSNKFIQYILDDNDRIEYFSEIQTHFERNIQKEIEKDKKEEKDKKKEKDKGKFISQLNDFFINLEKKEKFHNYNTIENEIDLSAAPGLINDYNFKKNNYNFYNIENNFSNNKNIDDSDIINMSEKENSSMNNSELRINLGETEFNRNEIDNEEEDYLGEKTIPGTYRLYTKGKLDPNRLAFINKNEKSKITSNKLMRLKEKEGNKINKSANNKKIGKYIKEKVNKKGKINKNIFKINLIKNNIKKFNRNKPPLTSRNENNNIEINTHIYSTQNSNYKKNKRKIIPVKRDLNKKMISKANIKYPQEKKEILIKDTTKKYLRKSKISNPTINIPPLSINNKKNKISIKTIPNKKKRLNTNIYENSNEIYYKFVNNHPNKSIDSRNRLNTQRNNELSTNLFKTIYNKNSNSKIINNKEKSINKNSKNNLKKFFQNNINSKSIEGRKKFIIDSTSKEKKINKSNVMNLIDNFHLYQKSRINNNQNLNKNNVTNKSEINKSSVTTNNNSKYKFKKDFSFIQTPLLTFDNNHYHEDQNKNNGFNTDRTRNIYNLKKQSCFEKEGNFTNSNNTRIKSKKKIRKNNFNIPIKSNQNDLIRLKIKDYYLKRRRIENLNIKEFNNTSYSLVGNKINSSLAQTTLNTNSNHLITTRNNNLNSNTINTDKCNTSRINVTLRNRSIKERNRNNMHKKMNTSILSSISKLKEHPKIKKPKIIGSKNGTENNNSKLNSLIKIVIAPNHKIKGNNSLSKNKIKKENINNNKVVKKNHHLESSVIVYRKKSPFKIRDLSDSPKQKYLNEKTRNNRIPWKIKKKGLDEKLDGFSIYNRYMNQFQSKNNNPFKKRNMLKKNYKNKNEKNSSFLNNSKPKNNNKFSLIPSHSNQKTLNISFSNLNKNNILSKDKENSQYNPNGTSQGFYKPNKNKNINSSKITINEYKKKDYTNLKNVKNKKNNKNIQKRNERILNYEHNFNLTQNYNNSNLKDYDYELNLKKNINESIKKKFNKSISFRSLESLNENDNKNNYEFEEPFNLSCLFIVDKKINECYNNLVAKLKKFGINAYQKNNNIFCNKNGNDCQISIIKFNKDITKNINNNGKYPICYKVFDKKNKNKKINGVFSKLIFSSN